MEQFKHKKSLGQNFLHDKSVLQKIKDSVDVRENDLVIEIGPGQGALTKYLKEFGSYLLCFEIDERVRVYLDEFVDEKTDVYYGNFLDVEISSVLSKYEYERLYIVANLPYYITTAIINHIIDSGVVVEEMVLMVQNEVADRFAALPGGSDYGSISVYLNYYFSIEKLFLVGRKCFTPVPNVDSAVIKFTRRDKKFDVKDEGLFFQLVKDAFKFKRKNLRNNLRGYDVEVVEGVLRNKGKDLRCRAEQLDIDEFVEIANALSK